MRTQMSHQGQQQMPVPQGPNYGLNPKMTQVLSSGGTPMPQVVTPNRQYGGP